LMITAIMPYSWRSTSLELVNGGSSSSIERGVVPPFSPLPSRTSWEQRVRRMKAAVALSHAVSASTF
jgi:hypothetical protein